MIFICFINVYFQVCRILYIKVIKIECIKGIGFDFGVYFFSGGDEYDQRIVGDLIDFDGFICEIDIGVC